MDNNDLAKLSNRDAEQVATHLAQLAGGEKPLADGLRAAAADATSIRLTRAMRSIAASLDGGQSLEEILSSPSWRFSGSVGNLIATALRSGSFALVLSELLQHHQATQQLRRSVLSSLAYPTLILSITISLLVGFQVFITPMFSEMFAEFGLALPPSTLMLISFSRWWTHFGIWILLAVLSLVIGIIIVLRVGGGRLGWSRVWATVPFVGPLSHWTAVAQWSRLMGILVDRHVPLSDALRLAADGSYDANVSDVSGHLAVGVEEGQDLVQMLAETHRLPAMLALIVQSGRQSGSLSRAFQTAGDMYEMRVHLRASVLRSVLPPLVFIAIGIFVGFAIIALFLPLVSMVQSLSGF